MWYDNRGPGEISLKKPRVIKITYNCLCGSHTTTDMGNEKFVSKGIKCLEEVSQAKGKNNTTSKKCKIICQREDICKRAPGAGGGLAKEIF